MKYILTELAKNLMSKDSSLDFRPARKTVGSSGYDLSACIDESLFIYPGETKKIGTGVHIWIDTAGVSGGTIVDTLLAGFLMPRSSIKGLMLTNSIGLADDDYQGELILSLYNYTDEKIEIVPGQRMIQYVLVFTYVGKMEEVEDFGVNTIRGNNGFGSSGK
jgi:dUTP pyrophosphatase